MLRLPSALLAVLVIAPLLVLTSARQAAAFDEVRGVRREWLGVELSPSSTGVGLTNSSEHFAAGSSLGLGLALRVARLRGDVFTWTPFQAIAFLSPFGTFRGSGAILQTEVGALWRGKWGTLEAGLGLGYGELVFETDRIRPDVTCGDDSCRLAARRVLISPALRWLPIDGPRTAWGVVLRAQLPAFAPLGRGDLAAIFTIGLDASWGRP